MWAGLAGAQLREKRVWKKKVQGILGLLLNLPKKTRQDEVSQNKVNFSSDQSIIFESLDADHSH
jgi:hypothetical protein